MNGSHNPNKRQATPHLEYLNRLLDEYINQYENFVFEGDFNVGVNDSSMKEFCSLNELKNPISQPTSSKNSEKPTYIDIILNELSNLFLI